MPTAQIDRNRSSSRMSLADDDDHLDPSNPSSSMSAFRRPVSTTESFSPSAVLMSMATRSSSSTYPAPSPYVPSHSPLTAFSSPIPSHLTPYGRHSPAPDPFRVLREHHLSTKPAWTVIPASEGFRILDLCKSLSTTSPGDDRVPCYNRETIFDEEWQAHMKDVHGVFLLWPQTWMRRIEVLDLDAFGGDIGACNDVIMEG
jgi:hypothetical protein